MFYLLITKKTEVLEMNDVVVMRRISVKTIGKTTAEHSDEVFKIALFQYCIEIFKLSLENNLFTAVFHN